MTNTTVVNAGTKYVNGLNLSRLAGTPLLSFNLDSGSARNSTNINDMVLSAPVTLDLTQTGPNGIDVGPVAEKAYAVYLIDDSTKYEEAAGLVSLDFTQPNLPVGYDMYRLIGLIHIDDLGGGAEIVPFLSYGAKETKSIYYQHAFNVLISGSSITNLEVELLNLSGNGDIIVPPFRSHVLLQASFTPAVASAAFQLSPSGSVGAQGASQVGFSNVAGASKDTLWTPYDMNGAIPEILYKVTDASDSLGLDVTGFEFIIF